MLYRNETNDLIYDRLNGQKYIIVEGTPAGNRGKTYDILIIFEYIEGDGDEDIGSPVAWTYGASFLDDEDFIIDFIEGVLH